MLFRENQKPVNVFHEPGGYSSAEGQSTNRAPKIKEAQTETLSSQTPPEQVRKLTDTVNKVAPKLKARSNPESQQKAGKLEKAAAKVDQAQKLSDEDRAKLISGLTAGFKDVGGPIIGKPEGRTEAKPEWLNVAQVPKDVQTKARNSETLASGGNINITSKEDGKTYKVVSRGPGVFGYKNVG